MIPKLESVRYVKGFTIHVKFRDGVEADLDLEGELWGEVFEPLKDPAMFQQLEFVEEMNTVVWPTGADLAPEFLYEKALAQQVDRSGR